MTLNILQISDLHFGEVYGKTGAPRLDATVRDMWMADPIFDGYLGHSYAALVALVDLFDELTQLHGAEPQLVVTGDFTRFGDLREMDAFESFANGPGLGLTGLRLATAGNWWQLSIPGNHDRWPGVPPAVQLLPMIGLPLNGGVPVGGVPMRLRGGFPWGQRLKIEGDVDLVLVAIDSDCDVGPHSSQRVFARGSFASQCAAAVSEFQRQKVDGRRQARILLVHHSPAHRGFKLGIDDASRKALDALIEATHVSAVLTGHAHEEVQHKHMLDTGDEWIELRCGTTTQQDLLPRHGIWSVVGQRRRASLAENRALFHRVGRHEIRTTRYWRPRGKPRFVPLTDGWVTPLTLVG